MPQSRLGPEVPQVRAGEGWRAEYCVPPGKLIGSNGMQFGPDNRLHVAEMMGSRISAVDVVNGRVDVISPVNGGIRQPDDLAFDSKGIIYATEIMHGTVSALFPDGTTKVLAGDMPSINGVTVAQDRIFVDEFRSGGRMWELFRDGSAPRLIAEGLEWPNALALGPDGYLYSPSVLHDKIIRVPVDGGAAETFVSGFTRPSAVKFDRRNVLHAVSSLTGVVASFDLQTRAVHQVGSSYCGADNLAIDSDDRIYVSHFVDGGIDELALGQLRQIVPSGFIGPFGLTVSADGSVYVADSVSLARIGDQGTIDRVSQYITDPCFPGILRNVAAAENGAFYTANSKGDVAHYRPNAELKVLGAGLGQIMGIVPLAAGGVAACDFEGGRLLKLADGSVTTLARGLGMPTGLAASTEGSFYVADAAAGCVLHIQNGETAVVLDGLVTPHGLTMANDRLFILDRGTATLHCVDIRSRRHDMIAWNLPVGGANGMTPHGLPGIEGLMPGPILPFAGLAHDRNGAIYTSADREGSVLKLSRNHGAMA